MRQHQFIIALGGTFLLMFCLDTAAQDAGPVQYGTTQEGRYGVGHDKWHRERVNALAGLRSHKRDPAFAYKHPPASPLPRAYAPTR